ncbi:hypothetical protein HDU85_004880 [Gaertneriomyces sp. JEL0708]|nr:hypothetical protein HDU85_004880 [Gaertneriomyces sp. JEL0708]
MIIDSFQAAALLGGMNGQSDDITDPFSLDVQTISRPFSSAMQDQKSQPAAMSISSNESQPSMSASSSPAPPSPPSSALDPSLSPPAALIPLDSALAQLALFESLSSGQSTVPPPTPRSFIPPPQRAHPPTPISTLIAFRRQIKSDKTAEDLTVTTDSLSQSRSAIGSEFLQERELETESTLDSSRGDLPSILPAWQTSMACDAVPLTGQGAGIMPIIALKSSTPQALPAATISPAALQATSVSIKKEPGVASPVNAPSTGRGSRLGLNTAQSSSGHHAAQPRKKDYVHKACVNCKVSHVACDVNRPCQRCIRLGKATTCIDAERKKRGRPTSNARRNAARSPDTCSEHDHEESSADASGSPCRPKKRTRPSPPGDDNASISAAYAVILGQMVGNLGPAVSKAAEPALPGAMLNEDVISAISRLMPHNNDLNSAVTIKQEIKQEATSSPMQPFLASSPPLVPTLSPPPATPPEEVCFDSLSMPLPLGNDMDAVALDAVVDFGSCMVEGDESPTSFMDVEFSEGLFGRDDPFILSDFARDLSI